MAFDTSYMKEALDEAMRAEALGEIPIGAVLVYQGKIIARGHNQVETYDATHHAEMICIREGARLLGDFRLVETTLYVTVEPCLMCYGAILLSRIPFVVFGCKEPRFGACGSWVALPPHPIHTTTIRGGVLEDEAKELIQNFFRRRRAERRNSQLV